MKTQIKLDNPRIKEMLGAIVQDAEIAQKPNLLETFFEIAKTRYQQEEQMQRQGSDYDPDPVLEENLLAPLAPYCKNGTRHLVSRVLVESFNNPRGLNKLAIIHFAGKYGLDELAPYLGKTVRNLGTYGSSMGSAAESALENMGTEKSRKELRALKDANRHAYTH